MSQVRCNVARQDGSVAKTLVVEQKLYASAGALLAIRSRPSFLCKVVLLHGTCARNSHTHLAWSRTNANRNLGQGPLVSGFWGRTALLLSSPALRMPQEGGCTSQKPGGTRMFQVLQQASAEELAGTTNLAAGLDQHGAVCDLHVCARRPGLTERIWFQASAMHQQSRRAVIVIAPCAPSSAEVGS